MLSLSKDSPVTCMSITKKTQPGKKNCSWGESNVGRRMSSGGMLLGTLVIKAVDVYINTEGSRCSL